VTDSRGWRARLDRARAPLERWMPAIRVVRFVLAVALVVAMGALAVTDMPSQRLEWALLAPALGAAAGWWLMLARGWAILVAGRVTPHDVGTWCRTQVLRYVPGGIWAPTSRVTVVDGSVADRVATVAAENVVALCAALSIGGLAMALGGRPAWAPLVLAAAAPALLRRATRGRTRLDGPRVTAALANGVVGFVLYAACAVLVQAAISGWHDELVVAGAAGISWAAGLVVVFAPGGVGVRELAYVGLLASGFGHDDLVGAAVAMRVVTIAAELIVLVAAGRPGRPGQPKTSRRIRRRTATGDA
jgi:hypothetical protein